MGIRGKTILNQTKKTNINNILHLSLEIVELYLVLGASSFFLLFFKLGWAHYKYSLLLLLNTSGLMVYPSKRPMCLPGQYTSTVAVHWHICYLCCSLFLAPNHFNWYLTESTTVQLISSFITSGLDYGNSNFDGLPKTEIYTEDPNSAAMLVVRKSKREHVHHCSSTYINSIFSASRLQSCNTGLCSLCWLITTIPFLIYQPSCSLRSSKEKPLKVPGKNLKRRYGHPSFSYQPPTVWNSLLSAIGQLASPASFKTNFITHPSVKPFHHSH